MGGFQSIIMSGGKFENNCWYKNKHIGAIAKKEEIQGAVEFQILKKDQEIKKEAV